MPIVASTQLFDLDRDGKLEIVACDMGHGLVLVGDPARRPGELREIAKVPNPVRSSLVDLDRDGLMDLLVADVGFFLPEDHEKGAVVWLRRKADGSYEKRVLAEKLPRVTDVEAADFDGDGDLDLVVAAFGLYTRGGILLLENRTTDWKEPQFVATTLDERPGAIHVPAVDLDGDGRADFVALLAQQHETVVAFLNRGPGPFEKKTVFAARTPAWGSTGIELVDFDADGDLDVLMTNGATLDDATVKPWHGVRWLENRGSYPFEPHDLAALPGAHRAVAADLDGDGDLDVAVGRLPARPRPRAGLARVSRLAGAHGAGGLRAAHPAGGPALAHDARRGRRGRRRRRRPRHRQLRGLHLRPHRHRLSRGRLGRTLGQSSHPGGLGGFRPPEQERQATACHLGLLSRTLVTLHGRERLRTVCYGFADGAGASGADVFPSSRPSASLTPLKKRLSPSLWSRPTASRARAESAVRPRR